MKYLSSIVFLIFFTPLSLADVTSLSQLCFNTYEPTFGVPNSEPLGVCQWDMSLIGATESDSYQRATGQGVRVGVLDSGIDMTHPDIAPNFEMAGSCSFINDDTPTANPSEIANGDCSNKAAVQDFNGHGTHVASTIGAPLNGIGIAGVAPDVTLVALKVCTEVGYCFADSVAAALRYAGDIRLDVVNLSLFADPYLYYCKSEKEQRAILKELESAARYAQQRGVVIVASAGNGQSDLQHPGEDNVSPDWPPGNSETRDVGNNCRVAPAELPGVITVSATGPVGIPGYDLLIADYSSVGMSRIDVTAPGGDFFRATNLVQDGILGAYSSTSTSGTWEYYKYLSDINIYPDLALEDDGARYLYLNGTSMSSPHAAGVAALIKQMHPKWSSGAVKAHLQNSATEMACPENWEPLGEGDEREKCYGKNGRTSFFGHGMVNAAQASQ
ncbi:S8 family peptidase [Aestuariibacter salexigens]|uniref:S8 family peptidase n=1 Tax=Aestuariibacter salexigens TaxID=226010 RepID=UPI0006841FF3|nr:S8 family serine peptidase [Aestuariibacter salexigens]